MDDHDGAITIFLTPFTRWPILPATENLRIANDVNRDAQAEILSQTFYNYMNIDD